MLEKIIDNYAKKKKKTSLHFMQKKKHADIDFLVQVRGFVLLLLFISYFRSST